MLNNKTIAVLPFVNMSSSTENEYFSDGITEEIINVLAKVDDLKVTSRTSSFFFKDTNTSIVEIGKQLGVSTILEGSVRLSGNILRITAQLIQVKDDYHFWSETWDRELGNVFKIQDEISLLIVDKLREHFGHFEMEEHLVTIQTENLNAYKCCLKGRFYKNKWNPEDVKLAISFYEKAMEYDPKYSDAYLGLADSYSFLGTCGFMPFEEAWNKTLQYTNQDLKLNNQSAGAYYQLSNYSFFVECDYNKSLLEMKKAIESNPNYADAHQFISFLYIIAGDKKKSKIHLDIAFNLNPLSEETHFFQAYFHYMIEEYQKALEMLDICLSVNDKNIPAHAVKPLCLLKLGRYQEVIQYYDHISTDVVIEGDKTGILGLAYSMKNDVKNTKLFLEELERQSKEPNGFTADSYLFMMYAINGAHDKAFEWVADSVKNKSTLLRLRYTDPLVNSLKSDSRYLEFKNVIYQVDALEKEIEERITLLDDQTVERYTNKLLTHLSFSKPYLDPKLSLRDLAKQIEIHPNHLSWLLNNGIGKNFNEFINSYRIEAFKMMALDSQSANLTIETLAYESGFNSKTVFNTCFKKGTGLTPKQFLKNQS